MSQAVAGRRHPLRQDSGQLPPRAPPRRHRQLPQALTGPTVSQDSEQGWLTKWEGAGGTMTNLPFDILIRAAALADLAACAEIYEACQDEILFPGSLAAWTRDEFATATAGEEILVAAASDGGGPSFVD